MRQKPLAIKRSTESDQSFRKKQILSRSLDLLDYGFVKQELADFCTFSGSRKIANEMVPSYSQSTVSQLQIETEEGVRLVSNAGSFSLAGIKDHGDSIKIADLGGILTGQEFLIIANTIEALSNARGTLVEHQEELPVLLERWPR